MHNAYSRILTRLAICAAVAAGPLAGGLAFLLAEEESPGIAIRNVLWGCGLVILGAGILAPALARLIAEPIGNLFHPGDTSSRKQPMYSVPESKRARGLYEEAIQGFEAIAKEYPGEVKPWVSMIDIAIVKLEDPERGHDIFQRGVIALKKHEDRQVLSKMYRAISSRCREG